MIVEIVRAVGELDEQEIRNRVCIVGTLLSVRMYVLGVNQLVPAWPLGCV